MSRLALSEDVALAFDPTMLGGEIGNNSFFGTSDDADAVDSLAQNAESEFRERVDDPFRVQHMDRYEKHAVPVEGHSAYQAHFSGVRIDYTPRPSEVNLNHSPVLPIDSAEGDIIEIRKGMNNWTDVTSNSDDEFELISASKGKLLVDFAQVIQDQGVNQRIAADRRWVRIKYRFGASGGDHRLAGETTIETQLNTGNTPNSMSVGDASLLPPPPFIALVLDESDPRGTAEYIRIDGTDTSNNTIDVAQRAERLSTESNHSSGETLHYAPLFVRDAVAKRAAIALTQADQYSEWLPDTDLSVDAPRKLDEWRRDWKEAIDLLS